MAKETRFMLTTIDNPFDPFDDFASWFIYDSEKGYNSCRLLAAVTPFSDAYSEDEKKSIVEFAIDTIVENDFLKIYKKVSKEVEEDQ